MAEKWDFMKEDARKTIEAIKPVDIHTASEHFVPPSTSEMDELDAAEGEEARDEDGEE